MFAVAAMPIERPVEKRSNSYHHTSQSAFNSPAGSRRSSVSSMVSAQTDPGMFSDHSRQSSTTSTTSTGSKSGFKSLFGKKDKKPKEKKDMDKIILTSKHTAAVKTKMMMDPHLKLRPKPNVKTAGIVVTHHTGHSTAAQQEARHPHSGPPALHPMDDLPILTRIASGDERDDEEEFEKLERARLEWDMAKLSGFTRIKEHESDESTSTSADQSADEGDISSPPRTPSLSPNVEKALFGPEPRRPVIVSKNSYGGRFHKDEKGNWKR